PKWPDMTKPVIGAINGAAVTGGLELALYCDILIASENAKFADTHARVGLMPTWGLSVRLPQKVGVGLARRMSLTGDYLSAQDALRAGLVTEVVAHDDLLTAARRVA
ncbi:enoyl-CoA hydratase-related protein, partial [Mycobacteroides abscessus subsp. abscessus]